MANENPIQIVPDFTERYPGASPSATEAAMNIVRTSSRPLVAADTAPTKVSAMKRPKSISDIRSTGLSTASRTFSAAMSSLMIVTWRRGYK